MTNVEKYVKSQFSDELTEVQNLPIAEVKNGLTVHEKTLIYHYTKDGYRDINRELRFNSGKKKSEIVLLLEKCLKKLPDHRGLVHRTADASANQIERYRAALRTGEIVRENTFVSTTRSPLVQECCPDSRPNSRSFRGPENQSKPCRIWVLITRRMRRKYCLFQAACFESSM